MAKKEPTTFNKAPSQDPRLMFIKIEAVIPIDSFESYNEISDAIDEALEQLRASGGAEVVEQYEITNDMENACNIICDHRTAGDQSGEGELYEKTNSFMPRTNRG